MKPPIPRREPLGDVLTVHEIAGALFVTVEAVREMIADGRLPCVKRPRGRIPYVDRAAFSAWLAEHRGKRIL